MVSSYAIAGFDFPTLNGPISQTYEKSRNLKLDFIWQDQSFN